MPGQRPAQEIPPNAATLCFASAPPAAETQLTQRDAAELVADKKPLYLSLTAGKEGSHFMLIEMKQAL